MATPLNTKSSWDPIIRKDPIKVILNPDKTEVVFKNYATLLDFVTNEIRFWEKYNSGNLMQILSHFQSVLQMLNKGDEAEDIIKDKYRAVITLLTKPSYPNIYSKTRVGRYVENRYEVDKDIVNFALSSLYLPQFVIQRIGNSKAVYGIIEGYFIMNPFERDGAEIDGLKTSLNNLNEEYLSNISTLKTSYIDTVKSYGDNIDSIVANINSVLDHFKVDTKSLIDTHTATLTSIENTYEEKLRLDGPASYWEKYAQKCTEEGERWRLWAILSTAVTILCLTGILTLVPYTMLITKLLSIDHVISIVIFALIVSLMVYIIRLFVRLSLSSYHLARDAKERKELIYLFLTFLKEGSIKPEDRTIILQSLFSRAETGLLKGDNSPTMPEGVLTQVFKNIGGQH